jgi:hypothetical protein
MPEPAERPPIAQEPLSVILLAREPMDGIAEEVGKWAAFLNGLQRAYEVLILDQDRAEPLAGRAEAMAAVDPHFRMLPSTAPGSGAALRAGLAAARFPLVFYAELGDQYECGELRLLLDMIDQVDLVAGRRVWRAARGRRLREYLYGRLVRLFFGVRLRDVNCAFKLFRKAVFTRIPIQSDGHFAHAEIVAKANFLGCLMTEVPVTYRPGTAVSQAGKRPSTMAEARRVFGHPDFGPAKLPEGAAASPTGSPGEATVPSQEREPLEGVWKPDA